jgi:hypothetical protein
MHEDSREREHDFARAEARRLRSLTGTRSWYSRSEGSAALELLRRAAPATTFFREVDILVGGDHPGTGDRELVQVAQQLEAWVRMSEAGVISASPYAAKFRLDGAADLLEQAEDLLDDPAIHPAASAMLIGAAFEQTLRGLLIAHGLEAPARPSLTAYVQVLRKAEFFSKNDEKHAMSIGATRNEAAHGEFERISSDKARLMLAQVNQLLASTRRS